MKHGMNERGSAMVAVAFVGIALAGIIFAMVSLSGASAHENASRLDRTQLLYVAEAGIAHALIDIRSGGTGNLGQVGGPVPFGPGMYTVTAVDNGNRTYTVTSTGIVHGKRRTLRTDVRAVQGVFHHAMFAGNSSGEADYTLGLGGTDATADVITGDIFSAGNIGISGDAKVDGLLRAGGTITGASGYEGVSQPNPDIAAMSYGTNNDVDVAAEFAKYKTLNSSSLGGDAYEVPQDYASHIFRLNPTDRKTECDGTVKEDYFLEDPWHNPTSSTSLSPSAATEVSLGDDGTHDGKTRLLYYIDGNLWIHNLKTFSFALSAGEDDVLITFVVKGNIYFSDNVLLRDPAKDGVAFIAIKDDKVEDSGNIIFGDKTFGTLEKMEAFMFAENDFRDQNLPATGSEVVEVRGLMSAGNQINIEREKDGRRTKLVLEHDDRLMKGLLDLPGIPAPPNESYRMPFTSISLIEVGSQ
jgi:hypothetical protein